MNTLVYLRLLLFTRACLPMFTSYLPIVTLIYLCLPVIYVSSFLTMFTLFHVYLPHFNHALLPMLTLVYSCLPMFALV